MTVTSSCTVKYKNHYNRRSRPTLICRVLCTRPLIQLTDMPTRCPFRGLMLPVHDHLPLSDAEFNSAWTYTSTPSCFFIDWGLSTGTTCVISGVRRGVNRIFALNGYYAALIGSWMPTSSRTAWSLKMGQIGCPETSVTTNQCCVTIQKSEGNVTV